MGEQVKAFSIQGCYNGDYADTSLYWLLDSITADIMMGAKFGTPTKIAKGYYGRICPDGDTFVIEHDNEILK